MGKIKLLLYCVKAKPYLVEDTIQNHFWLSNKTMQKPVSLNGKIVAECDFEIEKIIKVFDGYSGTNTYYKELEKQSWLSREQFNNYLKGKNGYAIHIKNLTIFDKPRELNEFYNSKDYDKTWQPIIKAPQNMMYADYINIEKNIFIFKPYILISIRPEWLVKILNGEKIIEVRKKVLKEMMQDG